MAKILGLDLGTNSIGWAIIDDYQKKILGTGVRIFPEGVDNLGDGERELSKNASRTQYRSTRRQVFRRKMRKRMLLKVLAKNGMCPVTKEEIAAWNNKEGYPKSMGLTDWFKLDPYTLRAKATADKISLMELGRVFYHMSQRRGFLSNSRSAGTDEGVLFDGKNEEGKTGINSTIDNMGNSTLGEYLNSISPKPNEPYRDDLERIRNRYTIRKMYVDEFERIWKEQAKHHEQLTSDLKETIGGRKKDGYGKDGILFYQRELRSQKHTVGKCSFEPKKHRSPISALPVDEFRVYQWVNTVECNGSKLSEADRQTVVDYLLRRPKPNFKAIRKAIKKQDAHYNFNYKDDDKIVGTNTISELCNKKYFGEGWFELSPQQQEDVWHALYFFEDRDKLKAYAKENWGFDEERAERISKLNLKDGYSSLSRKAINNILPFLKRGFTYDVAVALGGVKNAFGSTWHALSDEQKQFIEDNVPSIVKQGKRGGYLEDLRSVLRSEFSLSEKQLEKLYHHSASINAEQQVPKLPKGTEADREIQSIRNPVVATALFEVRKVVNELITRFGAFDQINVEMARDLKVSKSKRNDIRREQKRLEKENDRVRAEVLGVDQRSTHENILKYKLWEECDRTCPYTGKKISLTQLFNGDVQIEHIIPWSRSLNDSYMNKTLCFADENRAKGDLTPFEYYSKQGPDKWEEVKQRALTLFSNKPHYPNAYAKFKQFVTKKFDSDFISRQLNDTRYISKEAKNYLEKICDDVQVSPGQMTANLRHKWGMNEILNNEDDSKTRDDHRHHAVDALVMACSKRKYLQELSKWNRYYRSYDLKSFPMPWEGFWKDAKESIDSILVSHKKDRRVLTITNVKTKKSGVQHTNKGIAARGALHKETVYGKRQAPNADEAYHVRKPIDSLTTKKHIDKVVDPAIRQLILQRIDQLGGFVNGKIIPDGAFFKVNENKVKTPQLFLPNKNGAPVPIKKVRMREALGNAEVLKDTNQYVNPRNNHHVLIYKDAEDNLKEDVVTFWTAVERKLQNQPIVQLPEDGTEIVTTLMINDTFILGQDENVLDWNNLEMKSISYAVFKVQSVSSMYYEFRLLADSRSQFKFAPYYYRIQSFGEGKVGWKSFSPIKVHISASGIITKL
jgi:CRISPR-associated endonuclease Csn1